MSERSPNYGAFSQFDEAQDTTTIPPISSFAKRNTRLSTSADSEERSQSTGYYRELTLEGMSPNGSASNTSQTPTSPIAMQPQSSQPQQQQQHQGHQRPGSEQQYAKAVAAAVAAAYQAQAQAQEMSGIADGGMVPVPVPAAAGSSGTSISSVPGLPVQPATSGAVSVNMASPPPLLPMQVANSSLLGQALQAANDMGGLSALQLAVQQQQLQQQQQFLHAVQAAHAQNAGHKMMSPTPSNEQALTLNNQGASPPGDTDSRDEEKTALVNLMPPSSLASPVSIQQGDQADLHAMVPSSQMQTPISSQLLTTSTSSDNAYTMPATAAAAPLPSINMPAGMMAGTNHVSNLNMGLAPHLIQLNNPQASMPVPQMVIQPGGPAGQEMVSPEQMMVQGVANITNNNNIDMMSNMPTQCTSSSTKRRNSKRPVPDTEKDEKYFERRSRNNMAAKRSRDSRKRREDQVSMRANFLQKENDILRAQLATLRQEANSLKQLLTQQRPIMPAQMSMQMPTQVMPKNMPE